MKIKMTDVLLSVFALLAVIVANNDVTVVHSGGGGYSYPYPYVVSITRMYPSPTTDAQVGFEVRFSESVSGVDLSDFSPIASGLSGSSLERMYPIWNGRYGVIVNTGLGTGLLGLGLYDNDSIRNAYTVPLGGTGIGNGDYTSGEIYTIEKVSPPTPKTPSGTITDRTPKYTWTKVNGATEYQYQLKKGTAIVYTKTVLSGVCDSTICSSTPTNLLDYSTYKWWVRAKIGGAWGGWSPLKTFVVARPVAKTPTGTITDRTPKYTWTKVNGATEYQYQLKRGTAIVYTKTVLSGVCGSTICSSTPTNLLDYSTYKWWVRAKIGGVWGGWSPLKTFVVARPVAKTPTGTITDRTPKYTWTKVNGATEYQYQLKRGTAIVYTKTVLSGVCGSTTCSNTPTNLLGYSTYKWWVRAKIGGVWGGWSPLKTFTVSK